MPFLLSELDTAREELAERKRACVVIGRGYRDLRAELAAARQWSAAWKHYAKWQRKLASLYKHYDWALDMQRMSDSLCRARWAHKQRRQQLHDVSAWERKAIEELRALKNEAQDECSRQRHTIGRLVQYLADAYAGYELSGIERRLAELGLTWADAIGEDGEAA